MKKLLVALIAACLMNQIFSYTLRFQNLSNARFGLKVYTWGLGTAAAPKYNLYLNPGEKQEFSGPGGRCFYRVDAWVEKSEDPRLIGLAGSKNLPELWRCIDNDVHIGISYPPDWVFPTGGAGQATSGGATAQQTVVTVGATAPKSNPEVFIRFK